MAKVTILLMLASTVVILITFGKGMGILRGGDIESHLYWAGASLVTVLGANMMAMFHAAQSDRIIRDLRARVDSADGESERAMLPARERVQTPPNEGRA
jgi:hypothetical protein